jgi:uncharacterized protein (TIGR02145 family)
MNQTVKYDLSILILVITVLTGCKKEKVPVITTTAITNITATTATSGGNIPNDGGAIITARGVCWSTSINPTITDSKTTNGTGTGTFISLITGLTPVTKYYLRAYATNSFGTAYGNEIRFATPSVSSSTSVTDIDSNIYNTVTIGNQVWMKENLKTTRYNNGDLIGTTTPATLDISNESSPKYQWSWNGNDSTVATYGRFYTWYAVTDSRNVCPTGWHVPTNDEWITLTDYLTNNGYGYGGSGDQIAKSMAYTSGWTTFNTTGTIGNDQGNNNSSGFTALPGGFRYDNGTFTPIGETADWWSATEFNVINLYAWGRDLGYNFDMVFRNYINKQVGWSVRCLRD